MDSINVVYMNCETVQLTLSSLLPIQINCMLQKLMIIKNFNNLLLLSLLGQDESSHEDEWIQFY